MARSSAAVVSVVELHLLLQSASVCVPTELAYDPSDPFAVSLTLVPPTGPAVHWLVARDLLRCGLTTAAGEGDVALWPLPDGGPDAGDVCLVLSSPEGEALLLGQSEEVRAFLARTEDLVPVGSEEQFLDVDALVTALLAG